MAATFRSLRRGTLRAAAAAFLVAAGAQAADENPALSSLTYLGGERGDEIGAVAVAPDGALWIAAASSSRGWPGAVRAPLAAFDNDVLVLRLDPETREVLSSLWIGGTGTDAPTTIAFGAEGHAFVGGSTSSPDFPGRDTDPPASAIDTDAFVVRIAPDGSAVEWSVVIGGRTGQDSVRAARVLPGGDVAVAGSTSSTDFPSAGPDEPLPAENRRAAFLARVRADGSGTAYAVRLGGSGHDDAESVALTDAGTLVLAGRTRSADFPSTESHGLRADSGSTGFLAAFDAATGAFASARLLGGTEFHDLAVLPSGALLGAGQTRESRLPVATFLHLGSGGFCLPLVARIDPVTLDVTGGTQLELDSPFADFSHDARLAVAADGTVWTTGTTRGADPSATTSAHPWEAEDVYLASVDPATFRVLSQTVVHGSLQDARARLAPAADGGVWVAATTLSLDLAEVDPVASATAGWTGYDGLLAHAAPAAPRGRPAAPADLAAATTARTVRLTWTTAGPRPDAFEVERADIDRFSVVATLPGTATEWTDESALADRGYTYTVRALGADGPSPLSHEVRAVTAPSVEVVIHEGSLRARGRRRDQFDLRLAGEIAPAEAGATTPDVTSLGITMRFFGTGLDDDALRIGRLASGWHRTRTGATWRSGGTRFDWNSATGAFRLRVKGRTPLVAAARPLTLRVTSGSDVGSVATVWRLVSDTEIRTP